jgi:diacylglycerol kinase family enzyme
MMHGVSYSERAERFTASLAEICSHALLVPQRPLRWTIIANPKAGGFTIPSRWKRHEAQLAACVSKARDNPLHADVAPSHTALRLGNNGLVETVAPGHAASITEALLAEAPLAERNAPPFHLVITAGGDGTIREVQSVLLTAAPPTFLANCAVLRLPLGTGNDGADAWELDQALALMLYPATIAPTCALRLTTATGAGPFLAFNILSVGLDAFVTHMTNRMKGNLPGDSYKLWVDIASLLYDRLYTVGPMSVRAMTDTSAEPITFREKVLLMAVGASGGRTYGSHKRILPDERNVCVLKQMPLFRKLALKGLFNTGTHIDKPEALLFNARRVEFCAEHPLLAQMDGETTLLQPRDFPAAIELTQAVIPVLRRTC